MLLVALLAVNATTVLLFAEDRISRLRFESELYGWIEFTIYQPPRAL